ncbi:MAG: DUF58 domain-containing protein [Microbacteriaceae bacterium]
MLLMVAAVCLITGYASARTELMYIAAFTALMPLSAIIYVRMRQPRLETRRDFHPTVISAGQVATATLQVRNRATTPTPQLRWSELLPWAPYQTPVETLAPIPPRRTVAAQYTLQPPRRGIMNVGPMTIEFSDPFSLAHVWRTIAQSERIVVTPAVVALPDIGLALAEGDGAAQLIQRRAAGNDDDLMTREYRAGDALRRVHWRASARQGELMVRQEEQRTFPEARIIIDTLRSGYDDPLFSSGPPGDSDRFEWAVSMLASLGVHLHAAGYRVHIVETGARQVAPLGDAHEWAASDSEFLISLADIRLLRDREGVGYVSDEQPGARGPVFALISEPSDETLDWLIGQRRPFDLALAFVLDGWSDSTSQALTSAGWHCIEVSPEVALADAWTTALVETGGVHGLV